MIDCHMASMVSGKRFGFNINLITSAVAQISQKAPFFSDYAVKWPQSSSRAIQYVYSELLYSVTLIH